MLPYEFLRKSTIGGLNPILQSQPVLLHAKKSWERRLGTRLRYWYTNTRARLKPHNFLLGGAVENGVQLELLTKSLWMEGRAATSLVTRPHNTDWPENEAIHFLFQTIYVFSLTGETSAFGRSVKSARPPSIKVEAIIMV